MSEISTQLAEQSLIVKQGEVRTINANMIKAKNARPAKIRMVIILKTPRQLIALSKVVMVDVKPLMVLKPIPM